MPCIAYKTFRFHRKTQAIIAKANAIIAEYRAQGMELTLRQLYYQFVARGFIPNKHREYKNLGQTINDARLAGQIDWHDINDRTRNLMGLQHWNSPQQIINNCAASFRLDKWANQAHRLEVWIEKDALVGVIDGVCTENDVNYFSCRGYTSQSEMWSAGRRLASYAANNKTPIILHLGDHDPSGVDMSRDIEDRLELFAAGRIEVRRLALNWDQIKKYAPPPNPAKITDSRAKSYIKRFGNQSWELDALEPKILRTLIQSAIDSVRDNSAWQATLAEEREHIASIERIATDWNRVIEAEPTPPEPFDPIAHSRRMIPIRFPRTRFTKQAKPFSRRKPS